MADDLDAYLKSLPDKLVQPIARAIHEQAQMLSDAQRATLQSLEQAPPDSGDLDASCRVVPGRNDLEVFVVAGGDLTTRLYERGTDYAEAVVIDGRSNEGIAKRTKGTGSGVGYDHALAFEFGNSHQPARPFFYSTYRDKRDAMQEAINQAIEDALK